MKRNDNACPDAKCIDVKLNKLDKYDENSNLHDSGNNVSCPFCNTKEACKWHTKDEINSKMLEIGEKFLCYNVDLEVYFLAIYRGMSRQWYGPGSGDHFPDLVPTWEIDDENYDCYEIDYWMKLPKPPKPEEK